MIKFISAALLTGILFAVMDGLINGNPWASKLMEYYKPITRQYINIPAGIVIDLVYGFIITGIYYLLLPALPSDSPVIKGLVFGTGIWFFRVVMSVASGWIMFTIPVKTYVYILIAGFIEMTILGIVNGLLIRR